MTNIDNLPDPDVLATEIIENIEAGLESFKGIIEELNSNRAKSDTDKLKRLG